MMLVAALVGVLSAATAGTGVALYDRQRAVEGEVEYAEMTCSSHLAIESTDDRAPGALVQLVTNAARSGNHELWLAAYDLQQDVVAFGATSEQVAVDRDRIASLCAPILG